MTAAATYTFVEHWARTPELDQATQDGTNSRTHGVCVAKDGTVIVFGQRKNAIMHFAPDGTLIAEYGGEDWLAAHGLTYQVLDGQEVLWLTDQNSGKVAKTTLTGEVLLDIAPIVYTAGDSSEEGKGAYGQKYSPTWAVQDPSTGRIFLADGYGQHVVHLLSPQGEVIKTLTGEEGAGRFSCPHGINLDAKGRLLITDRGNSRLVVYSQDGDHLETYQDVCHSPCCFDFLDDLILVPELVGSVKVLNDQFEVVAELGQSDIVNKPAKPEGGFDHVAPEGWPNLYGTDLVKDGMFNSPHGGCFAPNGDIYVAEWIVGGRITKLAKD